ncbi:conserved hypothetical protein [Gammaproteobacteria bacterium]
MATITKIKDFIDSQEYNGSERYFTWRKSPTQITTTGIWFDLSMSPGNPTPKYWFDAVPLQATQIKQSTDGGLFHGSNVSPATKYIREMMAFCVTATALPMPMILCDYLLYYPTIDESVTDIQTMTNSNALPRYTDGSNVKIMAVSLAGRTGGASFTISYTNSSGVSGRTTATVLENSVSVNGSIVNSAQTSTTASSNSTGPFIQLQSGDTGVRSIESVTMNGVGDVGLFSLILVRPLVQFSIRGIDAPVEIDYLKDFPTPTPIVDDAFLNFLCLPQGSLAASAIHGSLKTTFY